MTRFRNETEEMLRRAGWSPGRTIAEQVVKWEERLSEFRIFRRAREALNEFGGLRIDEKGPGIECAREPFHLDPTLAVGESDRFARFTSVVGSDLYPFGDVVHGHGFLAMAEDGKTYMLMDSIWFAGEDFDDALDGLVRGRAKPML